MQKFLEKHYKKIIFLVLVFMLVVSLLNSWNESAIFDETAHIGASYSYVTQHEMRLNPEHPPLIKDLAGLPLLFFNLKFDTSQPFWTGDLPKKWDEGQWAAGRNLLYEEGNDADQILFWSRLPIILISLLLGWLIFYWAKELAGISAGLLALVIYAFDPNILGHNHFVTTDLGIAAAFAFCFYFYLKFVKEPSWKNTLLAGIFLGILQLTKFSFVIGLPVLALTTVIYPLARNHRDSEKFSWGFKFKKLGEYILKGLVLLFVSLILVWLVYFLNTFKMSKETMADSINFNFPPGQTENIKEVYTHKLLHGLNSNAITRPLVVYGEGIGYVFRRVAGGNGAYFMGEVSSQAFPAYFPTVFAIKEPLVNLFLMLAALVISFSLGINFIVKRFSFHLFPNSQNHNQSWKTGEFIRHNIVSLSLFAFVLLYAYVSITGNLNIGFRHLFPILPFIYILTAKVIFDFIKKLNENSQQIWKVIIFMLSVILILGTICAYPFYMSYFNQIADGPKNGYNFVTDSNADWGQDLKRLRIWIDNYNEKAQQPIKKIHINYFGGGDTNYYLGDMAINWWDSRRPIEPGWYAISTNYLMGSLYDKTKSPEENYSWLENKKPLTQVGTSFLIYYFTPSEINSLN